MTDAEIAELEAAARIFMVKYCFLHCYIWLTMNEMVISVMCNSLSLSGSNMCHSAGTTSHSGKSDFKFSQNQNPIHNMSANFGKIIGRFVGI